MLSTVNDYIEAGLTHSIHTSERRSFRGCRLRWNWISREFYYPNITARPLEFGVAFHAAMEEYYRSYLGLFVNPDPAASLAVAIAAFKQVTAEQRDRYVKLVGAIDEVMDEDYKDRVNLGVGMLRYYFSHVAPFEDRGLKPLKVEIKFEVPIPNPKTGEQDLWCKCDWCWRRYNKWILEKDRAGEVPYELSMQQRKDWKGLPVTFGGRLDILFEDELGRYWIGDWKTAMRLSGIETDDSYLELDDQITGYVWALRSIGIPVVGFVYAELKKAVPEEPEPLKVPRLGRRFSVGKNQPYMYEIYRRTVEENDPDAFEAGLYDEYLEWLEKSGTKFHLRHPVMRNDEQCQMAGLRLWQEAKEMIDPDLPLYPNPGRFHCGGCAFFDVHLGMDRGEDYTYTLETMFEKRDRHYWETAEPTTDKRMEPV